MTPPTEYDPTLSPALDEEQEKKLIEFKEWMETIILNKEDPYYPSERGFLTEETAKRYLRARKWEMDVSDIVLQSIHSS
jgi:hypothetical protein